MKKKWRAANKNKFFPICYINVNKIQCEASKFIELSICFSFFNQMRVCYVILACISTNVANLENSWYSQSSALTPAETLH